MEISKKEITRAMSLAASTWTSLKEKFLVAQSLPTRFTTTFECRTVLSMDSFILQSQSTTVPGVKIYILQEKNYDETYQV